MSKLVEYLLDILLIIILVGLTKYQTNVFSSIPNMFIFVISMYILTVIIVTFKCKYRSKKCNKKNECTTKDINWSKLWIPTMSWVVWVIVVLVLGIIQKNVPNPITSILIGLAMGYLGLIVYTVFVYYNTLAGVQSDCVPNIWEVFKEVGKWFCTTSVGKWTPMCLVSKGVDKVTGMF